MKIRKYCCLLALLLLILVLVVFISCGIYFVAYAKSDQIRADSDKSGSTEILNLKGLLASTIDGTIISLDPGTGDHKTLVEEYIYQITAYDYYANKTIYYGSTKPNEPVLSLSKKSTNLTQYSGLWTKTSLAVDFIGGKVYLIDGESERLYVMDLQGRHYAVVLSDLHEPKDIVLDPKRSLMFILQTSSILRGFMDGTDVTKIANCKSITALTIDRDNAIIYFATSCAIKRINYLTNTLQTVTMIEDNIISLAILQNQLYFIGISKQLGNKTFMYCSVITGICKNKTQVAINNKFVSTLRDIKAVNSNQPISRNPCQKGNGGCEHLCILAANEDGYSCVCNLSWKLNSDLRTCSPVDKYLLYVQSNVVKGRVLDPTKTSFTYVNASFEIDTSVLVKKEIVDFDVNSQSNYIIYIIRYITGDSSMHYANLLNNTKWRIGESSDCNLIPAIDWVTNNLYYVRNCDNNTSHLIVRSIDSESTIEDEKVLLVFDGYVGSLVVHPNRGKIFFTQYLEQSGNIQLHMVNLDGREIRLFPNFTAYKTGLTIDYTDDRLYWLSEDAKKVQYMHLDSLECKFVDTSSVENPKTINVFQDWIYISSLSGIWRFHKETDGNVARITPIFKDRSPGIQGVKVVGRALQPISNDHPCVVDNGGCERYCFAIPFENGKGLQKTCACNNNEELRSDRTCLRRPKI